MGAAAKERPRPVFQAVAYAAAAEAEKMKAVSGGPHRKTAALLWSCVALALAGCATSEEVALTLRVKELEAHIAGAQDDNAMLMNVIAEQNGYIRELEMGAAMQADYINRIRRNCDL